MVEHRKNVPTRKAYVPSGWFIVLTIMICLGGAGWLAMLVVGDSGDDGATPPTASASASPSPSSSSSSPSPDPKPTKSGGTKKTPKPSKTPEPTPEPTASAVTRDATVAVFNNTGIVGAAKAFSAKVSTSGWTLGSIGNWRGSIDGNTIYYPADLQAQAELLGQDVGIDRLRPSVAPMQMDRLTIILSDPR